MSISATRPRDRHPGIWLLAIAGPPVVAATAFVVGLPNTGPSVLAREATLALEAGAPQESPGQAGTPDSVVVGGKPIACRVLDVTRKVVVVRTMNGKLFFDRGKVESIARAFDEDARDVYREFKKKARTAENWKKLARFSKKKALLPEYRECLRKILELEPDNNAAHRGLGRARLDGKWISEQSVELKLAAGYTLDNGELVRESKTPDKVEEGDDSRDGEPDSRTVVKPGEPPKNIKLLPRTKLSKTEARKIEAARKERAENAEKFRLKMKREYRAGSWNEFRTRHFFVLCNSSRDVTRKYGAIMELIRAKLSKMFLSKTLRRLRAPVRVHANQEDFISTDQYARWGGRGLGGYYMPSNQSITTYHGTFGFTGTTFGVLAHEGTHYYQGLVLKGGFDNLPIWLIEGLAVYFGDGSKFDAEKKKITVGLIPRDRLSHLQEKMLAKRHTKIDKLVSMTRYNGFSGSHYADAWGLIYFLVNHPSKKGEKLMQRYWATGIERKLNKGDFLDLADKYFDGVENLEKEYVDFTLNLEPPPAGEIKGDYFVSDTFQFEFKAPGVEWEFFADSEDKKMLVGMIKPGTDAQVRIYYENNIENAKAPEFFEKWIKNHKHFEDLEHEKVKIGGLGGYKVSYTDTGERPLGWSLVREGGRIVVRGGGDEDEDEDEDRNGKDSGREKEPKKQPREVLRFMLVQIDGVATIECSTPKGRMADFEEVFSSLNENLNLILIRRW